MACCIHVVTQLSIADILLKGPKTLAELAAEAQSDAKSLSRLLRAVTSVGIFTEKEDGTFELE
ncbi:methyltransferase family protein [Sphingobacterium athyrii]|uniref:O-methyltransferase dimerisation domain-containing protein n=1 Tax=Sphingobacterium athyrii TaxID=2152717 RepID=A0A363NXS6_9SPHI|nr:hypothetical protein DCO56_01110 [Sphingobacterium athyrii]